MDIQKLKKIVEFSDKNRDQIQAKVDRFYAISGFPQEREMLNIMQIVSMVVLEQGYLVLEIPFADREIGAMCYKGDALGYILLNTSLPKVNVNFALCHEVYHVLEQKVSGKAKLEFANEHYYEYESEFEANLFAGMLMMPETGFKFMYRKFKEEANSSEENIILKLMNYYQAPYMAVLIRCLELNLDEFDVQKLLAYSDGDRIREKFADLWLDESILNATQKDDYAQLEAVVKRFGNEAINGTFLKERTVKKVLQNMRTLYLDIKGE